MYDKISETIQSTIAAFGKSNNVSDYWKEPIIKIISAYDKNLARLKETVSPEHLMPHTILPSAKSIISFFIPFQEHIVSSNVVGKMASEKWAIAYVKTNELIKVINDNIETLMAQHGYKIGKIPATNNFDTKTLLSNWSHRHIAYIAGIGTFGINNMLITKNGCCGRFGSVILDCAFDEYAHIDAVNEKCLHKIDGSCGVCQKRCVVNAYENGIFDRHRCYQQCLENGEQYKHIGHADICGKCVVGLPCSMREPCKHRSESGS
jgi:epoxyqueuosine reductase QueG